MQHLPPTRLLAGHQDAQREDAPRHGARQHDGHHQHGERQERFGDSGVTDQEPNRHGAGAGERQVAERAVEGVSWVGYEPEEAEADSEHATWMEAEVGSGLQSLDKGRSSRLSTAEIAQSAEEDLAGSAS